MPKVKREKLKLIHPSSRKAAKMARECHKNKKRNSIVVKKATKLDFTASKFVWFQKNLNSALLTYNQEELSKLVIRYLARFDEELEQISIIRGIQHRNPTQHVARERAISLTKEREKMLLNSTGLEVPDLVNNETLRDLSKWDGDPRTISRFQSVKFTRNMLSNLNTNT